MQPQTKGHVAPTPGPWRVNTWPGVVNPCVVDAQNNAVASIVGRHRDIAVKLANARLIAAAPELLAACEVYVSETDYLIATDMHDNYTDRARARNRQAKAVVAMRDAIAKARGEVPS